ncbi:MAG: hypothetical protein ACLGHT_13565 [Acidimicrobiia bacterium]
MAAKNIEHAYVVLDAEGGISLILSGADAPEAATWYTDEGFRVTEVDLVSEFAAA